ncbi:IS4 family transposase [Dactylosporangium sp. CS-033363]|uniref:IS4 family transposase n=1 Tax=Dactylosporangium sp. CS-033363 TaxID=3239935 RepID=UPI003D8A245F
MTSVVVDRPVVCPDQVTLGVLISQVPRDAVDDAVAVCGVRERRSDGKLPAHVTAYLTLALALFPDDDYEEVAAKVTGSLDRFGVWDAGWSVPTSSAITQARKRLGRELFAELFRGTCGPVAGRAGPAAAAAALGAARGSFLRSWRLLAIDGFEIDVPDTPANVAEFGYAGSGEKQSSFPKARVVALAECGTHAFVAAAVGTHTSGEKTLAATLYPQLHGDELLTADRGFYSWRGWQTAQATGAALLWRAPTNLHLPVIKILPDGTYLSILIKPEIRFIPRRDRLLAAARAGTHLDNLDHIPEAFDRHGEPIAHLVRVIEYDIPDRAGDGHHELIALTTTILNPADARADELAAAYHQRWEQETSHDQLKTHLRGPGQVLRSRLPDLVHQEIWAYLIVHHAVTALITQASAAADLDPDQISFTKTLRLIRRTATGTAAIPPSPLD